MTLTTYKWSIDEWHKLVDSGFLEGKPVEFLEGEIIEVSPEGIEHSYTNRSVVKYLRQLLNKIAEIIQAQPITLDNSEPEPDITVVKLPENKYKNRHPYPQDVYWLIEISNRTLKKDLNQKIITYARNGIPEYWVIDLVNKKLIVHTQVNNNNYALVEEYTSGNISPLAFPDVAIAKLAEGIALDELLLY